MKNWTKSILMFSILLSGSGLITSCEKVIEEPKNEISSSVFKSTEPTKVGITCTGYNSCPDKCGMEGKMSSDVPAYIQCRCTDCVMNITMEYADGSTSNSSLSNSTLEVPYLTDFLQYVELEYCSDYSIEEITKINDSGNVKVMYIFKCSDGSTESVLYARASGATKSYRIDCTGSCDCREVYIFDTNQAECSCSDCVMQVDEVLSTN